MPAASPKLDPKTLRWVADEDEREMRRLMKSVDRMKTDLEKPNFANADLVHRDYPGWIARDVVIIRRLQWSIKRRRISASRIEGRQRRERAAKRKGAR